MKLRFKLRTILILIAVAASLMGYYSHRWKQLKRESDLMPQLLTNEKCLANYWATNVDRFKADHSADRGWFAKTIDAPILMAADRNEMSIYYFVHLVDKPPVEFFEKLKQLQFLKWIALEVDDIDEYADAVLSLPHIKKVDCLNRQVSSSTIQKFESRGIKVSHKGMKDYSLTDQYMRYRGVDYKINPKAAWANLEIDTVNETVSIQLTVNADHNTYLDPQKQGNGWYWTPQFETPRFVRKMKLSQWQTGNTMDFKAESPVATWESQHGPQNVKISELSATPISRRQVKLNEIFPGGIELKGTVDIRGIKIKFDEVPELDIARQVVDQYFDTDLAKVWSHVRPEDKTAIFVGKREADK